MSTDGAGQTMWAVTQDEYGSSEVLRLAELPRPVPIPTEVLVRVHASGVNPVDWQTRAGDGEAGVVGPAPFVLGWDVSGVVEESGPGQTMWAVGDEVFGMPWFPRQAGGYAQYVTAPARQWAHKPSSLDHAHAAAVPLAALTAWQSLVDTAKVTLGQRVLIQAAAGGVGQFAVQFARHLGATVYATASGHNAQWLRGIGADEVIDYNAGRFEDAVSGLDVVVDLVGDAHDTCRRSLDVLRPDGLLVSIAAGVSDELAAAARRSGVRVTPFLVEPDGRALGQIGELIDSGVVRVDVSRVYPLAEVAAAHRDGETSHTRGKLVLEPPAPERSTGDAR